jgi:hypothetical protein
MTYHPGDHIPTARRILAAWLVCLGVAFSGFALPALWHKAQAVVRLELARAAEERASVGSPHVMPRQTRRLPQGSNNAAIEARAGTRSG